MAWVTITEEEVRSAMSAPELSALEVAAAQVGQEVLYEITKQVVQECRAHIADCAANQLAEGDTVPQRVVHHVIAIVRMRMLTRVDMEASEDRRAEYRQALRFFERVSECKVAIEAPEGATEESGGTPGMQTLFSRDQVAGRSRLSGL